jgi:hypothetical protein
LWPCIASSARNNALYCGYPEISKFYGLQLSQLQKSASTLKRLLFTLELSKRNNPQNKSCLGFFGYYEVQVPKKYKLRLSIFPSQAGLNSHLSMCHSLPQLPPPPSSLVALIILLPLPHHLPTASPPVSVPSIESQPQHVPPFRSPEGLFLMDEAVPTMILALSDCQQW